MARVWSQVKVRVMHTINTIKKSKIKNPYLFGRHLWIVILIFTFCILNFLSGCIPKIGLNQVQDYVKQSQFYYRAAVAEYKNLITKGYDLDRLHYELGKLYYSHGESEKAIEEFKETNENQAKKFLAISYYRLSNFTDALEVFAKFEFNDDEYLYYYGSTCEKLNLYDKAQDIYNKITEEPFRELARKRLDKIAQLSRGLYLKDLEPDLQKIIINAPRKESYPEAGALILLAEENIEVTKENTATYEEHFIIKILNERGKKDFSEVTIGYDSTYEKVELLLARTIKPDGTVVSVGTKHIRDVSKYLNFPLYSNARAYIISMPEITEEAVIEYRLKIYQNQLINKKDFILHYRLQEREPIIAANFKLILPEAKRAHIKILNEGYNKFNARLNPEVMKQNNKISYKWEFKNLPQIIPELNMPPDVEINPAILISTFESWREIYDWWWNLTKDKIKTSEQINKKIKELLKDLKTDEQKLRAIYNFCAKEIRYVAVEYGQAGYEPHKAEEIFINKYGDCKDQAVLLVAMLKQTGFKAYPVLIGTKDYFDLYEDFPSVLFDHCIAAVEMGQEIVFLDPTVEVCSFRDLPSDDQGRKILLFKEDDYKIETTPIYPSEHNSIKQNIDIRINKQEAIFARKRIFTYGYYDQLQRFWLIYTQPELIQQSLKEKIQEISIGAKLINYHIKNVDNLDKTVVLEYKFSGPEYWTTAGSLRILPQLATPIDSSLVAKDRRSYPIDFDLLDNKEINFNIAFPSNFKVKYLPENVYIDRPWLELSVEYHFKDNIIYFREKICLKKRFILPSEYPEFKKFYLDLGKKIKQRVVLERQQ